MCESDARVSPCIVIVIAVATRMDARVILGVCSYGGVYRREVEDITMHDIAYYNVLHTLRPSYGVEAYCAKLYAAHWRILVKPPHWRHTNCYMSLAGES